ncbi:MAG: hypothetical protein IPN89_11960 [Saprospiraceae bacterium]|nr:hypothetical protein [Saprospiraceae bacterium]
MQVNQCTNENLKNNKMTEETLKNQKAEVEMDTSKLFDVFLQKLIIDKKSIFNIILLIF